MRPRCEGAWNWEGGGRFRVVCPLVVRGDGCWRCSVPAERVRPFWGRALAVYAGMGLCLYLGATGGLWLLWKNVGYREMAYVDVAWPGRWTRIKQTQAEHFRRQAGAAMERGDFPAALLALSTAEQLRRGGYEDQVLVARLWAEAGNVEFAKRYYEAALARYPERAVETQVAWHDQLLASGQLRALAEVCLERVADAGAKAQESLWEYSLFFALEHGRRAEAALAWRKGKENALPTRVQELMVALATWQRGEQAEAVRLLAEMRPRADEPLARRLQVEWLAKWGATSEAGVALNRGAAEGDAFERAALRYYVDVASGDLLSARANFVGLLRGGPLTLAQADRLCSLVVRSRDGASLRRTPGFFALEPLKNDPPAQAAFWVAALACKEPGLVAGARERYEEAVGGVALPVVRELDFRNQNTADRESPLFIASFVRLPRETMYALIEESAKAAR